jgi:hypothetical protein
MSRKRKVIIKVIVGGLLPTAWGFLLYRKEPTADTINSVLLVLGPSALSWIITVIAGNCVHRRLIHTACGLVALLLLVVQVGLLFFAMKIAAGWGGNPLLNPFTLPGSVGLVFCIVALVAYFIRGPRTLEGDGSKSGA